MASRGVSSPLAVVLLVALTVSLAAALAAGVPALDAQASAPQASLSLAVDAGEDRIALRHLGGEALSIEALTIRIAVDGTPLRHQPPVPFFSARGFRPGPTGPFNVAASGTWTAGEEASLRLAGTNAPLLARGDTVTVRIYADGVRVAVLETRA
jgi:flagellin-like protein